MPALEAHEVLARLQQIALRQLQQAQQQAEVARCLSKF